MVSFLRGSFLYFYPRSPCGERPYGFRLMMAACSFLSTLSLRRATLIDLVDSPVAKISIHALLAESDSYSQHVRRPSGYFYPRSPCGERQMDANTVIQAISFLSTLSLRRATPRGPLWAVPVRFLSTLSLRRATLSALGGTTIPEVYFYPRSPCGERRGLSAETPCMSYFYPRSPCGERRGHPSHIPWR